MINVLVKDTSEVVGFPDTVDQNTINSVIRSDTYGEISNPQPNWYKDKIQPVLEASGMDMFQPKFLGAMVEPDATRAFVTNYAKEATFGAFENKNPEVMNLNSEAQAQHPIASFTGALAGQTQAIISTAGLGEAFGLGKASELVSERAGKVAANVVSGAGVGALFGGITSSVDQINKSIDENTHPDLVKIGKNVLKDAGIFALYGVPGSISSVPVATAAIAGTAYSISKAEGASEQDALLNAAVMGIFHAVNSKPQTLETLTVHQDALDKVKADYLKAMNPVINDAIVNRAAIEHKLKIADDLGYGELFAEPEITNRPDQYIYASQKEWPQKEKILSEFEQRQLDLENSYRPKPIDRNVTEETGPTFKVDDRNVVWGKEIINAQVEDIINPSTPIIATENTKGSVEQTQKGNAQEAILGKPSAIAPIEGSGDTKTRGLSKSIDAKAIENNLTVGFGELPEYKTVNMKEQASKAAEIMSKDYEQAKRIALGQEQSPEGVIPESLFTAVENKAILDGDVNTLRDLAINSRLTAEATTMGQRIRTLGERDPESPVGAIKEVQKARESVVEKKLGTKNIESAKKEIAKEIKKEIKKAIPTKETWASFIQEIQC